MSNTQVSHDPMLSLGVDLEFPSLVNASRQHVPSVMDESFGKIAKQSPRHTNFDLSFAKHVLPDDDKILQNFRSFESHDLESIVQFSISMRLHV